MLKVGGSIPWAPGTSRTSVTSGSDARHLRNPGWSTLGDIGHIDDDFYLYLTDSKSVRIISGGVNIYPQEVEPLCWSRNQMETPYDRSLHPAAHRLDSR